MRTWSVLVAAAVMGAGCGSSSSNPASGGTARDGVDAGAGGSDGGGGPSTGGADSSAPPSSDAAPPDDNGSDVYPAAHHPIPQLTNFGGVVLAHPKVVTVTFKGNASRDTLRAFDDAIVHGAWWDAVTRGFGIGKGASGGYAELEDTVSNTTIDNEKDIKPWVAAKVASGALPVPDADTLYAIYYPPTTTITLDKDQSCQAFGAYHDSAMVTLPGGGTVDAAFAIMPDCGGGLTDSASHEFIEAATDPHPVDGPTYYMWNDAWAGAQGGEAADLCEGRGSAQEGKDSVARSWVNAAAAESKDPCQPADPGEVYFGAAVDTDTLEVRSTQGSYSSDGYLTVRRGEARQVSVVVFSEAKLPHDVSLVVGKRRRGAIDPTAVDPIAPGVTASLSRATGRNGVKVTLTLAVAADAKPDVYPFVVRAILESADYHSWPVILRVM